MQTIIYMRRLITGLLLSIFILASNSQTWHSVYELEGKTVRSIIKYNTDTFLAGIDGEGIYISYNKGDSWTQLALESEDVWSLISLGNAVIAGTYENDFYRAKDLNSEWEHVQVSDEFEEEPVINLTINSLNLHNDTVYACTYGSSGPGFLYTSADTGKTWINQWGHTAPYAYLDVDFGTDGRVFVATPFGGYYSDNKSPWVYITGSGTTLRSVCFLGNDSLIYTGDMGTWLSVDNGVSVQEFNNISAFLIFEMGGKFYAATGYDLRYTSNFNSDWSSLGLYKNVLTLVSIEDKLIAGTDTGIYIYDIPSGITHFENQNNFRLYPNPARDYLSVEIKNLDAFKMYLYNSLGDLVQTIETSPFNIKGFKPGVYFYQLQFADLICSGKIIIE
jgi:hypothetical protein